MSFRMSKTKETPARKDQAIFDGSMRSSGLPDMRKNIFRTLPRQPEQNKDGDAPCVFSLPEDDESAQQIATADTQKKSGTRDVTSHKRGGSSVTDLTPHLMEIERLKLTLLQVKGMIHTQDELILTVRQNLLRRMVKYLDTVKNMIRTPADSRTDEEIKLDLDNFLKEQQLLIVSLRQDKLKQLVQLKSHDNNKKTHLQQPKLNRQLSRSAESVLDDSAINFAHKPLFPRVAKIQRSETARADRSLYFGELAKKTGSALKRNQSQRIQKRRKSVDDIYACISETHLSRSSGVEKIDNKTQQPFFKLDKSGQLVFDVSDTRSSTAEQPSTTQQTSKPHTAVEASKPAGQTSETGHQPSKPAEKILKTTLQQLPNTAVQSQRTDTRSSKSIEQTSKINQPESKQKNQTENIKAKSQSPQLKLKDTRLGSSQDKNGRPENVSKDSAPSKSCHGDGNAMLSSDKDFVEVDDLIHFMENHKPPAQQFIRGYNAVNSASFREPYTFSSVENSQKELPVIKRDRITIRHSPKLPLQKKQISLDEGTSKKPKGPAIHQDLKVFNAKADDSLIQVTAKHSKQPSYTTSIQIHLQPSGVIPAEAGLTEKSPKIGRSDEQGGVPETNNTCTGDETRRSLSRHADTLRDSISNSLDEEVEFISHATLLSQIKPQNYTAGAATGNVNKTPAECAKGALPEYVNNVPVEYVNSAELAGAVLKQEIENIEDSIFSPEISVHSPESPLFQTFQEFHEQLHLMKLKTSSSHESNHQWDHSGSETESETEIMIEPRGQAPRTKLKPLLLKKPPRKSLKLKRHLSRSLTDLTKTPGNTRPPNKKGGVRPTSFIHDYENLYDVPTSVPVYANVGHFSSQVSRDAKTDIKASNLPKGEKKHGDSSDLNNVHESTKPSKAGTRQSKRKRKEPNQRVNSAQNSSKHASKQVRGLNNNDSVFDTKNATPVTQASSKRSRSVRRSASDDVIYEKDQKRLREDLGRLTELQDELTETEARVKAMWLRMHSHVQESHVEVKPKRSTLPRAMAPNFGKKWRCCIM